MLLIMKTLFFTLLVFVLYLLPVRLSSQSAGSDDEGITFGGALRFNYNLSSWKEGQKKRLGDFGYDMFRINTAGTVK